jgi:hypothetical protein
VPPLLAPPDWPPPPEQLWPLPLPFPLPLPVPVLGLLPPPGALLRLGDADGLGDTGWLGVGVGVGAAVVVTVGVAVAVTDLVATAGAEVVGAGVGEADEDAVGETDVGADVVVADVVGAGAQLTKATDLGVVESPPVMVAAAGAICVPLPVAPQVVPVWLCVLLGLCAAVSRAAAA